jgi:hypothetical protein
LRGFDEALLDEAAHHRVALRSLQATAAIWQDSASISARWQRLLQQMPKGSIGEFAPARWSSRRWLSRALALGGRVGQGKRDSAAGRGTTPSAFVSVVFREIPGRWRVETRADGESETSVLVINGSRSWSAAYESSSDGNGPLHPPHSSFVGIHASIAAMLEPDDVLRRQLREVSVENAEWEKRQCFRLVGAIREIGDWAVWPADSYDLLLDRQFGILLRFAAIVDDAVIASAELSDLRFNAAIPDGLFSAEPPSGVRWLDLERRFASTNDL